MSAKDRTLLASLGFSDPDKKNARHDLACQYVVQPSVANKLVQTFFPTTTIPLGEYPPAERCVERGYIGYSPARKTWRFTRKGSTETVVADPAFLEVPISKGEGQYRTTIGFVDAHIPVTGKRVVSGQHLLEWKMFKNPPSNGYEPYDTTVVEPQISDPAGPTPFEEVAIFRGDVFIEVKIAKESLGAILRQINLYREYRRFICARVHNTQENHVKSQQGDGCYSRTAWILVTDFPMSEVDVVTLQGENIWHVTLGPDFEAFVQAQEKSSASKSIRI